MKTNNSPPIHQPRASAAVPYASGRLSVPRAGLTLRHRATSHRLCGRCAGSGSPADERARRVAHAIVFARYNVTSERDLADALERVSEYVTARASEAPTVTVLRPEPAQNPHNRG